MKPYIEYLAEELQADDEYSVQLALTLNPDLKKCEAAADKYSDYKLAEFIQWKYKNFVTSENGKLDYVLRFDSKLILGKNRFKLSELIAIFNSETTV